MKTAEEIRDKIREEVDRLHREKGHMASITRGWIDALEWVIQVRN